MSALLQVEGLVKTFPSGQGLLGRGRVRAVDGVDLVVERGRTLGLVGESGSGKSTIARCVLGLERPDAGSVRLDGTEVVGLSGRRLRELRRRVQPVFQDPYASLDPRWTVGRSVRESLDAYGTGTPATRDARVRDLLDLVGLAPSYADRLPARLSGGQRQRVGIAAALASEPDLVVADEPVSALDVSVQAQVLNLLARLQRDLGVAVLFVSHDLGVVQHVSQRVAVLYLGKVVEVAATGDLFDAAVHPYTRALLAAVPHADPARRLVHAPLAGEVPSPLSPPSGCRFNPRCPVAVDTCRVDPPALLPAGGRDHLAACPVVAPSLSPT